MSTAWFFNTTVVYTTMLYIRRIRICVEQMQILIPSILRMDAEALFVTSAVVEVNVDAKSHADADIRYISTSVKLLLL